ncbi:hypothetical protein CDCA_CDCA11G3248 [Cyanidium caldarium]|uniref:Phospholipid/glycerol acyltransferase domain-containing protein n=1 Tax=Cyanidium caldarium TaxID=2771 RepID=A0AAV9IY33_CYACA|nr:hypothetical protein CDCA_CDCA11G3248 [Cyanidium caldarium]
MAPTAVPDVGIDGKRERWATADGGTLSDPYRQLLAAVQGASDECPFRPLNGRYDGCWSERLKTLLIALTLLPLRLLGLVLTVVFGLLLLKLAVVGLSASHFDLGTAQPLARWRRFLLGGVRFLARVQLLALGFWWIEERFDDDGRTASQRLRTNYLGLLGASAAPILVSNHVSLFETLYFYARFAPSFLAKAEVRDMPVFGSVVEASSAIFVQRSEAKSRANVRNEILRRAQQFPPGSWPPLVVFPEQTTTNGTAVVFFKTGGAFSPGLPVQPVAIRYPYRNFHPGMVGDVGIARSALHMCLQLYNRMQVRYLPVRQPSAAERGHPHWFAERVRTDIARALEVPVTLHDLTDVWFQKAAYDVGALAIAPGMNVELRRYAGWIAPLTAGDAAPAATVEEIVREFVAGAGVQATAVTDPLQLCGALWREQHKAAAWEQLLAAAVGDEGSWVAAGARSLFACFDVTRCGRVHFRDYVVVRLFLQHWLQQRECADEIWRHWFAADAVATGCLWERNHVDAASERCLTALFDTAKWRLSPEMFAAAVSQHWLAASLLAAPLLPKAELANARAEP